MFPDTYSRLRPIRLGTKKLMSRIQNHSQPSVHPLPHVWAVSTVGGVSRFQWIFSSYNHPMYRQFGDRSGSFHFLDLSCFGSHEMEFAWLAMTGRILSRASTRKVTAFHFAVHPARMDPNTNQLEISMKNLTVSNEWPRTLYLQETLNSYIKKNEVSISFAETEEFIDMIKDMVHISKHSFSNSFLIPVIIYCDRFIEKVGRIARKGVLAMLFTSTFLTLKFWIDEGVSLYRTARYLKIRQSVMVRVEAQFLKKIEFRLFICPADIRRHTQIL
ncbi:cyclin-P3-1-like [Planoprotostelium fungivorum]|uniref:Cyclin-P3-1-like n=1 Tax=Planoprotostelium fungivorum TaxID=1890364 RepID=A0A2P6MWA8_9EUKA|nr:cyclin-P3-1-like [Planoprotostelium fungivorum]